jgi:hypothetical protein
LIEGVKEKGVKENICISQGERNRRLKKPDDK